MSNDDKIRTSLEVLAGSILEGKRCAVCNEMFTEKEALEALPVEGGKFCHRQCPKDKKKS